MMIPLTLKNINEFQESYLDLISQYKNLFEQDNMSIREVAYMLDELKCFWLEKLDMIEFELEQLTGNKECFLLSGSIYLNITGLEHFYFKTLGDYHLIDDPFMKSDIFFRIPSDKINSRSSLGHFKKAYYDTIHILTKYPLQFYFLPIRLIAIKDESEHYKLMETFSVRFVSSIMQKNFSTKEDLFQHYNSYEEIENSLGEYAKEYLIFTDSDERGLSLREKIERYCQMQSNYGRLTDAMSESQVFWIAVFTWISQIIDILLVCTYLNMCPYIRYEVTFHYLVLLMDTFTEDEILKDMIEKSIIFYLLRNIISEKQFEGIDFRDYCKLFNETSLLKNIVSEIRTQKIDIYKGGISGVEKIIENRFALIINTQG